MQDRIVISNNLSMSPTHLSATPFVVKPITHYENFPVASWLCPVKLRPPIMAIYAFARYADDLADEGEVSPEKRLEDLSDYRSELNKIATLSNQSDFENFYASSRWRIIFEPLAQMIHKHALPLNLLNDLLSAFEQDVKDTQKRNYHVNRDSLLAYCRLSANPIGRLLLHLYGVQDKKSLEQSDFICTALQLINFWQDLSQDLSRQRHYLTTEDCHRFSVDRSDLYRRPVPKNVLSLIEDNIKWAEELMKSGQPLIHKIPGRAAWELRLVIQGGLRIIEYLRFVDCNSLEHRPKLGKSELPLLLWRSWLMR